MRLAILYSTLIFSLFIALSTILFAYVTSNFLMGFVSIPPSILSFVLWRGRRSSISMREKVLGELAMDSRFSKNSVVTGHLEEMGKRKNYALKMAIIILLIGFTLWASVPITRLVLVYFPAVMNQNMIGL